MLLNEELLDKHVVLSSWTATITLVVLSFVVCAKDLPRITINCLLLGIVVQEFILLIFWSKASSFEELIYWLNLRIFDRTYKRACLLLFWILCLVASFLFCAIVNTGYLGSSTSIHRKFFHLTISLVAITGLIYDAKIVTIAAHLLLEIFIIAELLRCLRVWPYYEFLDNCLLSFLDGQDSERLILTPMLLHLGVFFGPLIAFPWWNFSYSTFSFPLAPLYFAGVQTVGIGDSFAALIGLNFGRTKWPMGNGKKSLEGSFAMFWSQILIMPLLLGMKALNLGLFVSAAISTILEAHLNKWDNVLLSMVSSMCYYILG